MSIGYHHIKMYSDRVFTFRRKTGTLQGIVPAAINEPTDRRPDKPGNKVPV